MVLARLNAGWDFSSPNFGYKAWDNTPDNESGQQRGTNSRSLSNVS